MARGERPGGAAGGDGGSVQHAAPDGRRQGGQAAGQQAGTPATGPFGFHGGQCVEIVGVGPQLSCGPGQGLGHAGAQRCLQHRHRLVPDPDPGEPRISVVRVVPHRQSQRRARVGRHAAPHRQQRAAVVAPAGGHASQCPGARSAGQPEQDRLRLVVERVAEQHHRRAGAPGRVIQGRIAGRTSGRLRPPVRAVARYRDRDAFDRIKPETGERRRHRAGTLSRASLQAVINRDRAGAQPLARRHEREGGRERQRVGSAGAGRQHQVTGTEILQALPDSVTDLRDCRARAHARLLAVVPETALFPLGGRFPGLTGRVRLGGCCAAGVKPGVG